MKNGIIGEDGSYYSIKNAQAIAPEADLSDAVENSHNPYDDKAYRYRYLFSDDFSDRNAYKWTVKSGEFSAKDGYFAGQGIAFANATDFRDFTVTFTVNSEKEAGLIFRAQDDKNYYLATVSKAAFILYRVENGVKRVLASAIPEDAGNTVTVTVYVKNDEMRISANCTDCTAVDTAYVSGEIGFYSADLAIFDTLRVSYIAE
jgi:hypothetical protein